MSSKQRNMLIVFIALLIIGGIALWSFLHPTPVVAPDGETPTQDTTGETASVPTGELSMIEYRCTSGEIFTLIKDSEGQTYFQQPHLSNNPLLLTQESDTSLSHEQLSITFTDAAALLRTYYDGKEHTCMQASENSAAPITAETTDAVMITGEVLMENTATPVTFATPHTLTVRLQGMTEEGILAPMAIVQTQITALPATFTIPESQIIIGDVIGEATLEAQITDASGTIIYENTDYTPLIQESILPTISVSKK